MTGQKETKLCATVRKLMTFTSEKTTDLPLISDTAAACAAYTKLGFFWPRELTGELLALVHAESVDRYDLVVLLMEVSRDDELTQRLVEAGTTIDELTFHVLWNRHCMPRLSVRAWRELGLRSADGQVRGTHLAASTISSGWKLGLLRPPLIDSMLEMQELAVEAQRLLENHAELFPMPAGVFPTGSHVTWSVGGGARFMDQREGSMRFEYRDVVETYHKAFAQREGAEAWFAGVRRDGGKFDFGMFYFDDEPSSAPDTPHDPAQCLPRIL